MLYHNPNNQYGKSRSGVILIVVLVLLVVLSTLGYTLAGKVTAQRRRNQYIIDYQAARYGCDSALKYALATLEDINDVRLIARPNEPDFSDLFALSETQYKELLAQWAEQMAQSYDSKQIEDDTGKSSFDINEINYSNDVNGDLAGDFNEGEVSDFNDPNSLTIPGPYGPVWPLITKPAEVEIGSATVKIEIQDENAKYPIGWAMLDEKGVRREAAAGFKTFCEWMDVNEITVGSLEEQLEDLAEVKQFKLDFKEIKIVKKTEVKTTKKSRRRSRKRRKSRKRTKTTVTKIPASVHLTDFAKLFNSSLIDTEALAKPTIVSESRKESALKYMAIWGSSRVNINTAPRQVLEAAFAFGGDADRIAEEIIQRRRLKPFKDIEELRQVLFRYSDSIEKCQKYIVTASNFFTIKVTATSGVAEASAVIAVRRNDGKMEKIAVISG